MSTRFAEVRGSSEPDGLELPRALDSLIEHHVGPYVDHLASSTSLTPSTIGRNDGFRVKFFYSPETDQVLTKYEVQLRRIFRDYACGQHSKDPFGAEEKRSQKLLHKKPKNPNSTSSAPIRSLQNELQLGAALSGLSACISRRSCPSGPKEALTRGACRGHVAHGVVSTQARKSKRTTSCAKCRKYNLRTCWS